MQELQAFYERKGLQIFESFGSPDGASYPNIDNLASRFVTHSNEIWVKSQVRCATSPSAAAQLGKNPEGDTPASPSRRKSVLTILGEQANNALGRADGEGSRAANVSAEVRPHEQPPRRTRVDGSTH